MQRRIILERALKRDGFEVLTILIHQDYTISAAVKTSRPFCILALSCIDIPERFLKSKVIWVVVDTADMMRFVEHADSSRLVNFTISLASQDSAEEVVGTQKHQNTLLVVESIYSVFLCIGCITSLHYI
jgi:hypothetical protein